MLGLYFSSKLNWGSCIIIVAKTASKKVGSLILSMKFLSPEAALHLCKLTIRPCMEYCCYVRAGAHSCYLEILDKPQKRIFRTASTSLAASLQSLAHPQYVASLSFFNNNTFQSITFYSITFQSITLILTGSTGSTSLFSREPYSLF